MTELNQTDLDADSLKQLRMTQWQFNHFFDLCQLFATAANVIVSHLIQSLFLLLLISITHSNIQYHISRFLKESITESINISVK